MSVVFRQCRKIDAKPSAAEPHVKVVVDRPSRVHVRRLCTCGGDCLWGKLK